MNALENVNFLEDESKVILKKLIDVAELLKNSYWKRDTWILTEGDRINILKDHIKSLQTVSLQLEKTHIHTEREREKYWWKLLILPELNKNKQTKTTKWIFTKYAV